jgi:hypothetical protein
MVFLQFALKTGVQKAFPASWIKGRMGGSQTNFFSYFSCFCHYFILVQCAEGSFFH